MNDTTKIILAIGAFVLIGGFFARRAIATGIEAVEEVNEGTPFEGFGVVGTAGNLTDKLLGGLPSKFGSFIGRTFADLTLPSGG